jgi:DNA polymerase-3 subunit gamma/tau
MGVLRMLAFEPIDANSDTASAPSNSGSTSVSNSASSSGSKQAPPAQAEGAKAQPERVQATAVSPAANAATPSVSTPNMSTPNAEALVERAPNVSQNQQRPTPVQQEQVAQSQNPQVHAHEPAPAVDAPSSTVADKHIAMVALAGNNEWGELVERTRLTGLSKELAMNCACERLSPEKVELTLADTFKHLLRPNRVEEIQANIQQVEPTLGAVTIELGESDRETPAQCLERLGALQIQQTKEHLEQNPTIRALQEEFGAQINESTVKPVQ